MKGRYEAVLNGVALSDLDEKLLILNIEYSAPQYNFQTYTVAGRQGASVFDMKKDPVSVKISFELHLYSIQARQNACQNVISWARNGGDLEINDRPGQVLHCVCNELPSIDSVRDWTSPVTIGFTAYSLPYWEEKTPAKITLTGTSASGNLFVPGNGGEAFVKCTVSHSSSLSSLRVDCGSTFIALSGISVAANKPVYISYDSNGILSIVANNVSLLNKRTAASSDDLKVRSGVTSTFSLTASSSSTALFEVRGLWE